jgi:hypothetical protein
VQKVSLETHNTTVLSKFAALSNFLTDAAHVPVLQYLENKYYFLPEKPSDAKKDLFCTNVKSAN